MESFHISRLGPEHKVPSFRERRIIEQVCLGKTDKEIASALGLAVDTIKTRLSLMRRKFGCNRFDLVKIFLRDGQRLKAIELDRILKKYRDFIPPDAWAELQEYQRRQVEEWLNA